MGYYVSVDDSYIRIPPENRAPALLAMQDLLKNPIHDHKKRGGSSNGDKWFSWMNNINADLWSSIEQAIEDWGFEVVQIGDGGFCLYYDNKTGQEDEMLNAIAPYVEDGGYVIWRGEDGSMWKDCFEDGQVVQKTAKVTFE